MHFIVVAIILGYKAIPYTNRAALCCYSCVSAKIQYCKQQKFRGTKLSWFTGFYQNLGKTLMFLLQL